MDHPSSTSQLTLPSDPFILSIKALSISNLPKQHNSGRVKPFIVITLPGGQKKITPTSNTRNPKWEGELKFNVRTASSSITIQIFHQPAGSDPRLICSYYGSVQDLASSESHALTNDGITVSHFSVQLSYTLKLLEIPAHDEQAFAKFIYPLIQTLSSLANIVAALVSVSQAYRSCSRAFQLLSSVYKVSLKRRVFDSNTEHLFVALRHMLSFAADDCPFQEIEGRIDVIEDIGLAIQIAAKTIQKYINSFISGTELPDSLTSSLTACGNRFLHLHKRFSHVFEIQAWAATGIIMQTPSRRERDYVETLAVAQSLNAGHEAMEICSPGTRTTIISDILLTLSDIESGRPRIIWLQASEGTGKSSLAATISDSLHHAGHLGASFFFSCLSGNLSDPNVVFREIAAQLSTRVPQVVDGMWNAINANSAAWDSPVITQFKDLIVGPLLAANIVERPIVILLDGLDECIDPLAVLSAIHSQKDQLPLSVKFLITSRPEQSIQAEMEAMGPVHLLSLDPGENMEDIGMFIDRRLHSLAQHYSVGQDWPNDTIRQALALHSGGSFVWAHTVVKFIEGTGGSGSDLQIKPVLRSGFLASHILPQLDNLYEHVLKSGFLSESAVAVACKVLGAIVTAKTPLTAAALDSLLNVHATSSDVTTLQVIRPFGAVLSYTETGGIHVRHRSFVDFLTNANCLVGTGFLINVKHHNQMAAASCLWVMDAFLRVNICQLDPSMLPSEVGDLQDRISKHIPETLGYACRFWAYHVASAPPNHNLGSLVHDFYIKHLLKWLEVLSLLGCMNLHGLKSLGVVLGWLQQIPGVSEDLLQLAGDSVQFLTRFCNAICTSALNVYYSALPFEAKDSAVHRTYSITFGSQIPVITNVAAPYLWPATHYNASSGVPDVTALAFSPDGLRIAIASLYGGLRLWGRVTATPIGAFYCYHKRKVTHLTFSPDGKHLVSGSNDHTLRLWDGVTGAPIGGALTGHSHQVQSVAFSPDGERIVSASSDKTLRLWNGATGAPITGPLTGHSAPVTSVAFSPDGERIASGSNDCNIRLWDGVTGAPIGGALTSHSGWIQSLAYSCDGNHIVSVSSDTTLRLWSGVTGAPIRAPLTGHLASVNSAAFSPEGTRLVSGSHDKTLRLWSVVTGVAIGGALTGHSDAVTSVAFSPDGERIASGSDDRTLRLWNGVTGAPIGDALIGHSDGVTSVTFSPDGERIVSGSWDNTLRLWNGITGASIGSALTGHSDSIHSVAFSPDGTRFVSGSWDGTLRLWDGITSTPIGGALSGHSSRVLSVAFSPDGTRIVSGSWDGTLRLWDGITGAPSAFGSHSGSITTVTFSPNGEYVRSESKLKEVLWWNVKEVSPSRPWKEHMRLLSISYLLEQSHGWLTLNSRRILYIPEEYRENAVFAYSENGYVVFGSKSGLAIIDGSQMFGWWKYA